MKRLISVLIFIFALLVQCSLSDVAVTVFEKIYLNFLRNTFKEF